MICTFAEILFKVKKIFSGLFLFITLQTIAQNDTIPSEFHFSGNVGVTNNGISIIPTFSLQAPAFNTTLSFSNGSKFSIDPDLRLTFDGKKGGGMVWFRYKLIQDKKWKLTLGAHPAYNFALKSITENGKTWTITQARRFWATEVAPVYVVNNHFALGLYYLNGHGLQEDGPQSTHFINMSASLMNMQLGKNYTVTLRPQVYYLKMDKQDGYYLTGNVIFAHSKTPFSLNYSYNKEINSNITGSKAFDWNVTLAYSFSNKYKR